MAQKYKVYYNDKAVFISDDFNASSYKIEQQAVAAKKNIVKAQWEKFKTDRTARELVFAGDAEAIWKEFKKLFVFIKAAGGLVKNTKGEYLLIYRNSKWDLPKGKMEKGEKFEQTAIREVAEECGLSNIKITNPLGESYHIYPLKGKEVLKQTCWFAMTISKDTEHLIPQKEEGIEKAVWVKPALFKQWKNEMYPSVWNILKNIK